MNVAARNTWVGRVLVEELARLETPLVCLAPGARCAPLSMALGATRAVPWATFVDERSAAFHAVGVARATGRPAVVVTTSGTAVGNLVPAAMEADRAGVPLLLITADRPADLRETAANQTTRQANILAPLTRFHADLPCSDPGLPFTGLLSTLDEAVRAAVDHRGPVHLNLQFREPLGPADAPPPPALERWHHAKTPWTRCFPSTPTPSAEGLQRLVEIGRAKRGLVVVGSLPHGARDHVQAVVDTLGWPTTCAADSSVRGGMGLDSALSDPDIAARLAPDTVLWIGGGIVSKRIGLWLRDQPASLELVSVTQRGARIDPAFRVQERHVVDYAQLAALFEPGAPDPDWSADWQQLQDSAEAVVERAMNGWTELSAARAVLSASDAVFLGASLPVRLADWLGAGDHPVHLDANRGASGIDGVLATAAGWSRHLDGRRRVLLGDLTCLHDQGSLPLVRQTGLQAVVFNNQGGSIFGMLPFGEVQGFDQVFRNTHDHGIAPVAAAMGLRTAVVTTSEDLARALADDTIDLIEARFDHDVTLDALKALHRGICSTLRAAWKLP